MKLYHAPGSCSLAICIGLQETGLAAEVIRVDARKHLLNDGSNFYDVNELGYVPVLELDDGTCLREGVVIAQYLADQRPETGLVPAHGTLARYRLLEWLNFLSAEIHKGFIPLLYAVAAGKYVETARPKLASRFAWVDRQLEGKAYLMGESFTVADAYLFAITRWGKASWMTSVYNADIDLSEYRRLRAWFARVSERASVREALAQDAA